MILEKMSSSRGETKEEHMDDFLALLVVGMFVANAVMTLINIKIFTEYVKDKLQDQRKRSDI